MYAGNDEMLVFSLFYFFYDIWEKKEKKLVFTRGYVVQRQTYFFLNFFFLFEYSLLGTHKYRYTYTNRTFVSCIEAIEQQTFAQLFKLTMMRMMTMTMH